MRPEPKSSQHSVQPPTQVPPAEQNGVVAPQAKPPVEPIVQGVPGGKFASTGQLDELPVQFSTASH
jgi:hypothetical protein